jgi:hypothetical protein
MAFARSASAGTSPNRFRPIPKGEADRLSVTPNLPECAWKCQPEAEGMRIMSKLRTSDFGFYFGFRNSDFGFQFRISIPGRTPTVANYYGYQVPILLWPLEHQ